MGIRYFPTNFVYWENVENHKKIKSVIMNKVLELDKKEFKDYNPKKIGGIRNATTNYQDHAADFHKYFEDDIIKQLVWDPLENVLSEINSNKSIPNIEVKNSILLGSWYTKYDKDGSFNMHYHYGNDVCRNGINYQRTFSIIYILNDPNENNTTTFTIPHGAPLSIVPNQQIHLVTHPNKEIKEGTVLIFPSSLYHEVLPTKIPGRITIAFNIGSTFIDERAATLY
jgi:hypothetical protein